MPDLGAVLAGALGGAAGATMITARVTEVGIGVATIAFNGGTFEDVPYLKGDWSPSLNEQVYVVAQSGWGMFILGAPAVPETRLPPGATQALWNPTNYGNWVKHNAAPYWATTDETPYGFLRAYDQPQYGDLGSGLWIYGDPPAAITAMSGFSKAEISVHLSAMGTSADSNRYGRLILHNNTAPSGTFAPFTDETQVFRGELDLDVWVPIPISWATRLVSRQAKGLAIYGPGQVGSIEAVGPGTLRLTSLGM